jgi:hypothetical protein
MSVTVLIVEKSGNIKEQNIKFDENELYKKAGHSSQTGFKCYAEWNIEDLDDKSYNISVYGKTTGRANNENKYEFPPPIDNTLFFGNCIILNKHNNIVVSLTSDEWDNIYEYLYGGFEDLGDEDSEEDEDDDEGIPLTKQGYAKDGFIVDDDDDNEDDEYEEEDEEEEEEEDELVKKSKSKKPEKKATKKPTKTSIKTTKTTKKQEKIENIFKSVQEQQSSYLDCTSELEEEEYV